MIAVLVLLVALVIGGVLLMMGQRRRREGATAVVRVWGEVLRHEHPVGAGGIRDPYAHPVVAFTDLQVGSAHGPTRSAPSRRASE